MLVGALEHPGGSVRDIVDARAAQSLLTQQGDGFMQVTAAVFEVGGRAAYLGDEASEQRGNGFARPGIRHRYPDAVGVVESECA